MVTPHRSKDIKVVQIGNSRGVRLPKAVLEKYAIGDSLVLEERDDGILLRNKKDRRLSWEDTYREMAEIRENWKDMDAAIGDGLDIEQNKW